MTCGSLLRLGEVLHHQQFVAAVVDHLHGDLPCSPASNGALMVPARWSQTDSSYSPLQRALEVVPGAGAGEERLADVEAEAVVVGVQEPRRHVVAARGARSPSSSGSKTSRPSSSTWYCVRLALLRRLDLA